jgi:hypothetical protein
MNEFPPTVSAVAAGIIIIQADSLLKIPDIFIKNHLMGPLSGINSFFSLFCHSRCAA